MNDTISLRKTAQHISLRVAGVGIARESRNSKETVYKLPEVFQALVGYAAHDGADRNRRIVGLLEDGDPRRYLDSARGS